jgi:hypothetical protein
VKTVTADGVLSDDDIVRRAKWARKYGPNKVKAARGQLREALAKLSLVPQGSQLWKDCQRESDRPADDVKREDLLTDRGDKRIKAETLLVLLKSADKAIHEFTSKADAIIAALTDPESKQQATYARDNALKTADKLTQDSVPQFLAKLDDIFQTLNDPSRLTSFLSADLAPSMLLSSFRSDRIWEPETGLNFGNFVRYARRTVAPLAVYLPAALLAFAIMAGAVATVFSAQYLANPSFGTPTDYRALFFSAYGSAQATAIAAALLLMRSPEPSYG